MNSAFFGLLYARKFRRFWFLLLLCSGAHTSSAAEHHDALWPNTTYDERIPTFDEVLGYKVGEKITSYADMLRYFEALESAAPER
ncbi:MAG: hypothetical protein HOG19_03625, partial [Gammaproteobacteria bacterium]|nr:hypothetical protein [Gammaproteobacteria bacterium]